MKLILRVMIMKHNTPNILVDADACPVKAEILRVAKKHGLPVIMVIDTSHELSDGYSTVVTVDKAADSVDFAIIARLAAGDVVVTQDFGLASMVLAKKARAINPSGLVYTIENIDRLLFERHFNQKARRMGEKTPHARKRTAGDNLKFLEVFERLIMTIV